MRVILILFGFLILTFSSFSQVDTKFKLDWQLFLSSCMQSNTKWVCGVELSAIDSTNQKLNVRLDLAKNWKYQDAIELIATLDTTQTYQQVSHGKPFNAMKYVSLETGFIIFLAVPDKYEYELSNGMKTVNYQFQYATIILPRKWKKYQKSFKNFYAK